MLSELMVRIGKAREVRRARILGRAEFEALKLDKFRRLVRHVRKRSPYYRRLIAERNIDVDRCQPSDFPVLTKSLLMQNFDEISTVPGVTKQAVAEFLTRSHDPTELFLGKYRVIHTSGTSGELGTFVYSPRDWARGMYAGPRGPQPKRKSKRKGKFRVAYYGAIDGHYAGVTMLRSIESGLSKHFVEIGCFEVNSPLPEVIAGLNEFQPDYLSGYTNALKVLAQKQREGALKLDCLVGVTTAGEATTEADRTMLEQAFGCSLVNAYGCSEHLVMGATPPGASNIVLTDHDLVYEFYPDHSVVTNLFNYTMPLIRYRMSDVMRLVDSGAHAPYLVIESLVGRNELQPVFKNRDGGEDFISPFTIIEIFVAGVTRFQMHLLGPEAFRFMVCLDSALDAGQRAATIKGVCDRLSEILARKRMDNVRFEVIEAGDLPVNPRTRKFQLIVDKRAG